MLDDFKISNLARQMVSFKVDSELISTKGDFLSCLSSSIKVIEINLTVGKTRVAGRKYPSQKKVDSNDDQQLQNFLDFSKLKDKIAEWNNESSHSSPFYPREFIKKILEGGAAIRYASRFDFETKIAVEKYGLNSQNDVRNLLISRIENDNEKEGMKFKEHQQSCIPENNNLPVDVYNLILQNEKENKNARLYVKFYVENSETCHFDLELTLLSFHEDNNQERIPDNQ